MPDFPPLRAASVRDLAALVDRVEAYCDMADELAEKIVPQRVGQKIMALLFAIRSEIDSISAISEEAASAADPLKRPNTGD